MSQNTVTLTEMEVIIDSERDGTLYQRLDSRLSEKILGLGKWSGNTNLTSRQGAVKVREVLVRGVREK